MFDEILLSCEHGGNLVPRGYSRSFASASARNALASHRGFDVGALPVARRLQALWDCELFYSKTSRLLVDLNRSPGHSALFSEFSSTLSHEGRAAVLTAYYLPHRSSVEGAIERSVGKGRRVLHLAVHSFVGRLHGHTRTADIGLLYDPQRSEERELCGHWKSRLAQDESGLRIRRNYPYRGNADGLSTMLRKRFLPGNYLGIEIEINQSLFQRRGASPMLAKLLSATLPRS